ncbi:glycosyltransferase [Rhodopirellula sallentina]|uniref:Glycosyltransferase n=1 Tax=Rhodopirellula sallentina SM41 TaxID=1263870 RepID=M5TTJ1_9BACT|nr:glycosyltransferase [Rhodopirellula sallentina]EMI52369.1 glycosyltransferase [Rhodopirellula sallentina SM41]
MKQGSRKRVAIVFYETYLGCAPSLINAARLFDENGWAVDVLMRDSSDEFASPPNLGEHVEVIRIGREKDSSLSEADVVDASTQVESSQPSSHGSTSPGEATPTPATWKSRMRAVLPAKLAEQIQRVRETKDDIIDGLRPATWAARSTFVGAVARAATNREPYDAVIGVDTLGLAAGHALAKKQKATLIYWSLEIMFLREFWSPARRQSKRHERMCHQSADVLVIQDEERQQSLCDENEAWNCPTILIPNSPRGEVSPGIDRDRFHRQFHLDDSVRVVLHAGSICEGMRSSDLAASAAKWSDQTRLIFHSHTPIDLHTHYYRDIVESGQGRVLISTQPVAYDELDALMASADVGVVIYDSSLGPNFQLLAGASGKLAHYLRCGVPVVSVDNPSIARVLEEHGCGIGVDRVEDVADAVGSILANREQYQARAYETYQSCYEFEKHFRSLLDFLEKR